jgi:DNA polymerase lambda
VTGSDLTGYLAPHHGKQSYMGICRLGPTGTARRIDIKTYPFCQYSFALLYFTGSAHYNRSMRLVAKKKQLKLTDEYLMERSGRQRRMRCDSEAEVFAALGLPYRTPAERNCPSDK